MLSTPHPYEQLLQKKFQTDTRTYVRQDIAPCFKHAMPSPVTHSLQGAGCLSRKYNWEYSPTVVLVGLFTHLNCLRSFSWLIFYLYCRAYQNHLHPIFLPSACCSAYVRARFLPNTTHTLEAAHTEPRIGAAP